MRSVLPTPLVSDPSSPPSWRALGYSFYHNRILRDSILADVRRGDTALEGWADAIRLLPVDEIPPSLLEHPPDFSDARLDMVPFTPVPAPLVLPWLPLPPAQSPAPLEAPVCPRSTWEMLLPETVERLNRWLRLMASDLANIREHQGEPNVGEMERQRPPPLAIGQTEIHPWARGRVWDCTKRFSECCVVADFQEPIQSDLNLMLRPCTRGIPTAQALRRPFMRPACLMI